MILKRGVKVQLVLFTVITVLVSVICVFYIGLDNRLPGRRYIAYVDLTDSGGIFSNAEVTYRGVAVGRVGPIALTDDGIKVRLNLYKGHEVPRDSVAVVANRSAVGEQYIDLQPIGKGGGPSLREEAEKGEPWVIPASNTRLPVSTDELLRNTDRLVSSVNPQDLGIIVDELHKAFSGSAADLQQILDSSDRLLETAEQSWPDTSELLDNSRTVLDTQRSQGANIRSFARNLNVLTQQLRTNDPELRQILDRTAPTVREADRLIDDVSPTLPVLLANLTTTGQVIASRIDGLRSLFILYPLTVAGAFTVTPGDGTQHLGLVLNFDAPAPCTTGYEKVKKRWPQFTEDVEPRKDVGCKLPKDSQQVVRGARNFPREAIRPFPKVPEGATDGAGFPAGGASGTTSTGDAGARAASKDQAGRPADTVYMPLSSKTVQMAGYDPSTGAVYGPDGKQYVMPRTAGRHLLGEEASWKWLLLGPLAQ